MRWGHWPRTVNEEVVRVSAQKRKQREYQEALEKAELAAERSQEEREQLKAEAEKNWARSLSQALIAEAITEEEAAAAAPEGYDIVEDTRDARAERMEMLAKLNQRYHVMKEQGRCPRCESRHSEKQVYCKACRQILNRKGRTRYQRRKGDYDGSAMDAPFRQ